MYRILYNDSTIFDPYGNENEVVTDASMSVEINAAAYMDFTMSRLHPLYNTIAERDGVVTLYWDGNVLFQGVIESIDIDIQGNKAISCVSALDYLNDTVVRPYSTIAGEQELTAPSSVDGYFQWLIDQHNEHVLDSGKRFDVGVNQGANLQQNNFIYRSSTNNPTTASEISDQLLDALGGYLTMRYVDDRYVLDLHADLHTMNAQIVDFGVNITDFSKTIDTKDQYTALILKGGSPEFQGGDFESGDWSHWVAHPNEPLVGDKTHGGDVSSYFVSGAGEYVNDSFFYFRSGRRYKATVYVKNERGSNVTIHGGYQYEQSGTWTTVNVGTSLTVENKDDQWVEFSFDFQPNLSEYTKIRPRWYFDNVANDSNRRVYLDDFSFSQVSGDTDVAEDPISVFMVPDGGTQYDSNILKIGDVIYDPSSVSRYGYKEEMYEDSTITDVDDLLQAGIKELNKLKDPQIGLDIKAVDLALFMEGYTHLNVGDAVRVRSAIHDTDEFLMVNSITLDLQDPGQSEYNIGKAYDSLTGQQSGFLRSLNSVESTANTALSKSSSVEQNLNSFKTNVQQTYETKNDALSKQSSLQQSVNNLRTEVSETYLTKTSAQQTYSTKSYVDQTARTVSLGVVEEYKKGQHGSALATQSDITAAKDSITSTVSQTYTTKTEFNNLQVGGTNIARDTQAFGHNGVSSTEEGYLKGYVNRTNGTYKGLTVRNIISSDGTGVAVCEYLVTNVKHSEYYTLSFWAKGSGKIRTYFYGPSGYIGAKAVSASNGSGPTIFADGQWNMTLSSSWQRYFVVYQMAASGGTSTDKYMLIRNDNDMASCDVCGVMIERGNKASDWSASPLDVSATYATKTEVKQTSDSLTVTISSAVSKAESAATAASNAQNTANTANSTANMAKNNAATAQSTANTANTNATNANNRVGNLETCIKMTTQGVRVGKISNGNFTGYSALVNSAGSFDILDSSTKTLASFNKDGLRVNSSSDRGMLIGFNSKTNSGYIGSTPSPSPIGGEHIDIGMNMEFSSGGHLSIINGLGKIGLTGNGIQLMTTGHGRVGINFVDVRGAGIVLFDKDDSHNYSSVEIAIGHNFSEFNYIMCFFKTNDGQYFGGTAYHPNGKEYNFMTMGGASGTTDMSYLKGTRWAFNGNTATRRTTFQIGPGYSTAVNDAVVHIVAIVGFDYYKTSG